MSSRLSLRHKLLYARFVIGRQIHVISNEPIKKAIHCGNSFAFRSFLEKFVQVKGKSAEDRRRRIDPCSMLCYMTCAKCLLVVVSINSTPTVC